MDDSVFVHPTACLDSTDVGRGSRIWAFVRMQPGSRVGEDCQLCDYAGLGIDAYVGDRVTIKEYAGIGQGTHVEDDVFIGPGVYTPNDVAPRSPRMKGIPAIAKRYGETSRWMKSTRIRRGASIGTGAIIAPGVDVGAFAMVGMGAIVTKDVPPHRLVAGHPARGIGWVCFCGRKLERQGDEGPYLCPECERAFRRDEEGRLVPEGA